MSLEFTLFDVDHGQCAAVRLPNGRWCLFDFGRPSRTPLLDQIKPRRLALVPTGNGPSLELVPESLFRVSLSHLHADHLSGIESVMKLSPEFLGTVLYDDLYLAEVFETTAEGRHWLIETFVNWHRDQFPNWVRSELDFGGATIRDLSLTVGEARKLGGSANTRVNNASLVTRIDYLGRSILLCGDMEASGWDAILGLEEWRRHVSGVDVLVAPHHGHSSGFSEQLLSLARPGVVLVSVASHDEHVDSRYSSDPVGRVWFEGGTHRRLTTRRCGNIQVVIEAGSRLRGDVVIKLGNGRQVSLDGSLLSEILGDLLTRAAKERR